jgi:endogenous inhibitor of DNA gyrase (YacG/DUF329 family)
MNDWDTTDPCPFTGAHCQDEACKTTCMAPLDWAERSCIQIDHEEPCMQCGQPTNLVHLDFEAALCSEECADATWGEWADSFRTNPIVHRGLDD